MGLTVKAAVSKPVLQITVVLWLGSKHVFQSWWSALVWTNSKPERFVSICPRVNIVGNKLCFKSNYILAKLSYGNYTLLSLPVATDRDITNALRI